jgi:hypothetical protein
MKKGFLALIVCGFLAACGGAAPVALDPIAIKLAPVTIPTIPPIKTAPVTWQVLTASDMVKVAKAKPNTVVYGLDQTNFKNLNLNLSEATRYMEQQKAVDTMLSDIITARQTEQGTSTPPAGQK